MITRRSRRLLINAVALLLVVSACTDGGDATTTTSLTTTTAASADASTTTTVDPRTDEVIDGYGAYWDAFVAASDPPDPDSPVLAEHATGEELDKAQTLLAAQLQFGEVARGTVEVNPTVVEITGDEATIADCWTPRMRLFDAKSGDLKSAPPVSGHQLSVELKLDGDVWKVSLITDRGACLPGPPVTEDNSG